MASLAWEQRPELRRPVLVAGFEGWNDAASAASEAAGWLTRQFGATKMASMDPEEHFDFQSARPTVELVDGVTRDLTWPANEFYAVPVDARDIVVLRGVEPNLRWPSFCRDGARRRRRDRMRDGRDVGRTPRRRPAHPARPRDGRDHRPRAHDEPSPAALALRGADGHRRRPARHRPRHRHRLGVVVGAGPALRRRRRPTRWRRVRSSTGWASSLGTTFELGELDELSQAWRDTGRRGRVAGRRRARLRRTARGAVRHARPRPETDIPSGEGLADEVEQYLRDQGPSD